MPDLYSNSDNLSLGVTEQLLNCSSCSPILQHPTYHPSKTVLANTVASAIKRNEIMPFTATWRDPEITILSEVSQTKTNII